MKNIRVFKSSEEFEVLRSVNQTQFVIIQELQRRNLELEEKIKQLEEILLSIKGLDLSL